MPKVRIVADYCSKGYQLLDAGARAEGELRISDELRSRLTDWNDRYEDNCHPRDYEDITGTTFDFIAFAKEGLEIARAVKRELPGWTVVYWDESLDWFLARDPRNYDPARSEYEVTLKDALTGNSRLES
jgi:hypothetical protein